MKFSCQREQLVKPLQKISSILPTRPSLPILTHVMIRATADELLLLGRDIESEMAVLLPAATIETSGETTVPARKLLDICRALPEEAHLSFTQETSQLVICSGRSKFTLATAPVEGFPKFDRKMNASPHVELAINQSVLRGMIEATQFAMARQDIRFYLNGMLFELQCGTLRTVASDGHRLAYSARAIEHPAIDVCQRALVPRKTALEILRLLEESEAPAVLTLRPQSLSLSVPPFQFTSQLLEGKFPDYQRFLTVAPRYRIQVSREPLRQALIRAAVLCHEELRGVRWAIRENALTITARNAAQEVAEEVIEIIYSGEELEISFNINYLLDVLNTLKQDTIHFFLSDPFSSVQIEGVVNPESRYVIMPMRL